MSELRAVDDAYVSPTTGARWHAVIGLEVHAQLKTASKLFCACANEFGAAPNANTCMVCTGQPGALPVLNEHAMELAIRAACAVGAEIARENRFDRKNYFYCDLPKGYQITQFAQPFCSGGGIELPSGKFVRLTRIHLEEDAGKAIHDRGDATLVDFNRAGIPLIESVTEADMASSQEAYDYLVALKEILQYAGVSDCDMEKGSLRCDVNVSVHPPDEPWRTKVEIKNLNSFRNVQAAIEHEIERQVAAYETRQAVQQETRLFDANRGVTRTMRSKEDAHDYRYFPDPDLPPFRVDASYEDRQRSMLPELPSARRERYVQEFNLSEYDAGVLVANRLVADFFEATVRVNNQPKAIANWISNEILGALADPDVPAGSIDELPFKPHQLAELVALVDEGRVHKGGAKAILDTLLRKGGAPEEIMRTEGLEQVRDTGQIEAWCRSALEGKDNVVADIKAGNEKAVGALIGPVMAASQGSANPQLVRETLLKLIAEMD